MRVGCLCNAIPQVPSSCPNSNTPDVDWTIDRRTRNRLAHTLNGNTSMSQEVAGAGVPEASVREAAYGNSSSSAMPAQPAPPAPDGNPSLSVAQDDAAGEQAIVEVEDKNLSLLRKRLAIPGAETSTEDFRSLCQDVGVSTSSWIPRDTVQSRKMSTPSLLSARASGVSVLPSIQRGHQTSHVLQLGHS